MNVKDLLTVPEAADKEGVSRTSIYNWINAGALPFIKKGAQRLIKPEALKKASEIMAAKRNGGRLRKKNRK